MRGFGWAGGGLIGTSQRSRETAGGPGGLDRWGGADGPLLLNSGHMVTPAEGTLFPGAGRVPDSSPVSKGALCAKGCSPTGNLKGRWFTSQQLMHQGLAKATLTGG